MSTELRPSSLHSAFLAFFLILNTNFFGFSEHPPLKANPQLCTSLTPGVPLELMHSWGFALREGVFAKPKEIYIKIQKEREESAMKRAGQRRGEERSLTSQYFNKKLLG